MAEALIPKHGGYRNLKSFRVARLIYGFQQRLFERHDARSAEAKPAGGRGTRPRRQVRSSGCRLLSAGPRPSALVRPPASIPADL
jgi:hypothetical protein